MKDQLYPMSDRAAQFVQNAFEEEQLEHALDALAFALEQGLYPTRELFITTLALAYGGSESAHLRDDEHQGAQRKKKRIRTLGRFEWQDVTPSTTSKAIALLKEWATLSPVAICDFLPSREATARAKVHPDEQVPPSRWLTSLIESDDDSDRERAGGASTAIEDGVGSLNPIFGLALRMLKCQDVWEILSLSLAGKEERRLIEAKSKKAQNDALREADDVDQTNERRKERIAKFDRVGTWHLVDIILHLWKQQGQASDSASRLIAQLQSPSQAFTSGKTHRSTQRPETDVGHVFDLILCGLMGSFRQASDLKGLQEQSLLSFAGCSTPPLALELLAELLICVESASLNEQAINRGLVEMFKDMDLGALASLGRLSLRSRIGELLLLLSGLQALEMDVSTSVGYDRPLGKNRDSEQLQSACRACLMDEVFTGYSRDVLQSIQKGSWLKSLDWQRVEESMRDKGSAKGSPHRRKGIDALLRSPGWALDRLSDDQKSLPAKSSTQSLPSVQHGNFDDAFRVIFDAAEARCVTLNKLVLRFALQRTMCLRIPNALKEVELDDDMQRLLYEIQSASLSTLARQTRTALLGVQGVVAAMQASFTATLGEYKSHLNSARSESRRKMAKLDSWLAKGVRPNERSTKATNKNPVEYLGKWTNLTLAFGLAEMSLRVFAQECEVHGDYEM